MLVLIYGYAVLSLIVAVTNGAVVFGLIAVVVVSFFLARIYFARVKIRLMVLDAIAATLH